MFIGSPLDFWPYGNRRPLDYWPRPRPWDFRPEPYPCPCPRRRRPCPACDRYRERYPPHDGWVWPPTPKQPNLPKQPEFPTPENVKKLSDLVRDRFEEIEVVKDSDGNVEKIEGKAFVTVERQGEADYAIVIGEQYFSLEADVELVNGKLYPRVILVEVLLDPKEAEE